MCSIGEDDFGDDGGVHAMTPDCDTEPTVKSMGTCDKCGATSVELFKQKCKECFLFQTRHKFRAVLGSSKVLPRDASVLLVFDGSGESVVLLDMVHFAQTQNMFKRLHCKVKVLYIDDEVLRTPRQFETKREQPLSVVKEFLNRYKELESFIIPIWGGLPANLKDPDAYLKDEKNLKAEQFLEKINAIKSLTSRQDYIKLQRNHIITSAANEFECKFAFLADTSSALAINLLSAIALGRGGSAALDVALLDDRYGDLVNIVRPLKDLTDAEIELYMSAQNLKVPRVGMQFGVANGKSASLQNMTRAFVENLQQDYASTVSTVFRTGHKIAVNRESGQRSTTNGENSSSQCTPTTCRNCHSPLDTENSPTLAAIQLSQAVSELGVDIDENTDISLLTYRQLCINSDATATPLCRGCLNIFKDCDNISDYLIE